MVIHYQKPIFQLEPYIYYLWEKSEIDQSDIPYEIETIFPEDQLNIAFTLGLPYFRAQKNPAVFETIDTHVIEALHTIPSYFKHQIGNHIFGIKFKIGDLYPFVARTFKSFINASVPINNLINIETYLIQNILKANRF